jgi:hypothetical protein
MSTFPTSPRAAFIGWCEVHAPIWGVQGGAIGLTEEQAAGFGVATAALQAAVLEQLEALQVYGAATRRVESRRAALRSAAGAAVASIRAFAEQQVKPNDVYSRVMIPAPAAPAPAPPPAKPQRLSAAIEAVTGNIRLAWKSSNPAGTSGTTYIVRRRIIYFAPAAGQAGAASASATGAGGDSCGTACEKAFSHERFAPASGAGSTRRVVGPSEFLGVTGRKRFVDATLTLTPEMFAGAAAPNVVYTVQGQRGDVSGLPSEGLVVTLGQSPASLAASSAALGAAPSASTRRGRSRATA